MQRPLGRSIRIINDLLTTSGGRARYAYDIYVQPEQISNAQKPLASAPGPDQFIER